MLATASNPSNEQRCSVHHPAPYGDTAKARRAGKGALTVTPRHQPDQLDDDLQDRADADAEAEVVQNGLTACAPSQGRQAGKRPQMAKAANVGRRSMSGVAMPKPSLTLWMVKPAGAGRGA